MLINTNKKYLFFILKDILKIKIKETLPFTLRFLCVLDTLQNLLLSSPYRTNAVSEVKLFVILAAFGCCIRELGIVCCESPRSTSAF